MTKDIVKAARRAAELSAWLSMIASNAMCSYEYAAALDDSDVFSDIEDVMLHLQLHVEQIHKDAEGKTCR